MDLNGRTGFCMELVQQQTTCGVDGSICYWLLVSAIRTRYYPLFQPPGHSWAIIHIYAPSSNNHINYSNH